MDPITHTCLGAVAGLAATGSRLGRAALLFGAVGGALPDVDVLWGHLADPALPWEYHRHFTHALVFIPIGAAIATLPLLALSRRFRERAKVGWCYLAALAGIATHGINDTLTSFGTFLYWPFSNARIAWDAISIIDPIFTLALILGILIALVIGHARPARLALLLAAMYIALGFVQKHRALNVQQSLAAARGHEIIRGRVSPTIGNIVLWRSFYEVDDRIHADAVRPGLLGPALVQPGESIALLRERHLPSAPPGSARIRAVFEKFSAFADDYTARVPGLPEGIGDMRYSLETAGFAPLWGLVLIIDDERDPVRWARFGGRDGGKRRDAMRALWEDLINPGPAYVPLEQAMRSMHDEQ